MHAYRVVENSLQGAIYRKFEIDPTIQPPELTAADARACGVEALALLKPLTEPEQWRWATDLVKGNEPPPGYAHPETVEDEFLQEFMWLTGGRP